MTFALHRKEMNKGCSDGSGRWLFEEFMVTDSIFGRAVVEYNVQAVKNGSYEGLLGGNDQWIVTLYDIKVAEGVVYDDDGETIGMNAEETEIFNKIVLDAFEDIKENVVEFERRLL